MDKNMNERINESIQEAVKYGAAVRRTTIKLRRGDYQKSLSKNEILENGEVMILCNIDGTKDEKFKYRNGALVVGDGVHPLNELPLLIRDNYVEFKVLRDSHYLLSDKVDRQEEEFSKYEKEVKEELKEKDDTIFHLKIFTIILIIYAIISGFVIGDTKQQIYDLQSSTVYESTIEENE